MKTEDKCYENYPLWIVLLANTVSIGIYVIGGYIIYQLGLVWLALYLLYILWLEARLISGGCRNCYYYGKYCAFGRGKISAVFLSKGSPERFAQRQITWKDILPDFLVSIIPLVVGIVLLVLKFDSLILALVILLAVLTTAGNAYIRGSYACKYCKQRTFACPAEKLFKKDK